MKNRIIQLFKTRSENEQAVIKNTAWLFGAEIGSRIARGILAIIAARMLGASGLGVWAYTIALGGLLTFFEDAGVGVFVTREFVKKNSEKESIFATALVLKIVLIIIAVCVFLIVAPLISSVPEARDIIPVVAFVLVFDSLRTFFFSIFRAEQRMHIESRVQIITNVLVVLFGLLFLWISPTPFSLALGYAVGGGIGCLVIFLSVRKYIPNIRAYFSNALSSKIFVSAWPFTVLAITNTIIFSTDTFLLGYFTNTTEVGWYSAASRVIQLFYVVPSLFATAIFPILVQRMTLSGEFSATLKRALVVATVGIIPLILIMTIGSSFIIRIAFGDSYTPAGIILAILSFSYIPVFIGTTLNGAVLAMNQQKKFVIANISGMILNIVLNYILIPRYHAVGSAIASVISLCMITSITLILLYKIKKSSHGTN